MRAEVIDQELAKYRERLLAVNDMSTMGLGGPHDMVTIARGFMEDLIFFADEVPDARRSEVDYLVDRFEALVKRLSH